MEADPWSLEVGFATERMPISTEEMALPNLHFLHRDSAWEACSAAASDVARAMEARASSPGDWLAPGPGWSEGGMQAAFDLIRSRGYEAGIWVAPFMVAGMPSPRHAASSSSTRRAKRSPRDSISPLSGS